MPRLTVKIADRPEEIEQALRLRYQVFAEEENVEHMKNAEGIERDGFDDYCDHLIVRDEEKELVVGVYRMLPGSRVSNGRIYTATEFDLGGFADQIPRALEIGRSCVHPDYRENKTMLLLWSGMLEYYGREEFTYLMGCASVRTRDLREVNVIYSWFYDQRYVTDRFRIQPLPSMKVEQLQYIGGTDEKTVLSLLPTMIKGYLRLGSEVIREPVYDPVFQTYDFCMILTKDRVTPRYRRRFLDHAAL